MLTLVNTINNPRKENGDFGPIKCQVCENYSSAYVELKDNTYTIVCKGCLLNWVDLINKTILNDCIEKGSISRKVLS